MNERKEKQALKIPKDLRRPAVLIAAGFLAMTAFVLLLFFYADSRISAIDQGENTVNWMDHHYAFISGDNSDLWQEIYASAKEHALEQRAYLEWIGNDAPVGYSISDCLQIATASRVDGIILHKSVTDDLTGLIDEAWEMGIPLVTVLEDDSESQRISYVGVNNYQMGEHYARQVLQCLQEGENHILVISGSPVKETSMSLIYSQMVRVTEQEKEDDQAVFFDTLVVNTSRLFDAEEDIRDVFVSQEDLPTVIVCLDTVTTECVAQALVDYNQVGNVSVIGFYSSETIADAISRDIVHSTLELDAAQIGRLSVDALDEYLEQGRVSNYFNVSLSVANAGSHGGDART